MIKATTRLIEKWRDATFSSLSNHTFRRIWAAGLFSNLGGVIQIMAASWLMVTLTDSSLLIASVQTAAAMPLMLFAILGGASADVFDRRLQILVSLGFCALATSVLYTATLTENVTPLILLVLTGLISVGAAFFLPAWQASIVDLVSRKKLSSAAALNNLAFSTSRGVGPAMGAEIIAFASISAAFLVNFVSYIVLMVAVASWRPEKEKVYLPRQRLKRAIYDGFRYISVSPNIWRLLFRSLLFGFGASVLLALPPLLALDLGGGPRTYGLLLAGFGAGAVFGGLFAAALRETYSNHRLITVASAIVAVTLLGLYFPTNVWLLVGIMSISGAAWVLVISTINVAVQLSSPRWVAARTIASATTAFQLGISTGAIFWGLVAASTSVQLAFLFAGIQLILATLLCHRLPVFQPTDDDLEPIGVPTELTAPEISPRAGPIVVTVDYIVPQQNSVAFMRAMHKIRQVRLRDGARQWSLRQDIDNPDFWLERFQSPTWGDYIHRLHRSMRSDSKHFQQVRLLCRERPVWHRRIERPMGARPLRKVRSPDIPPGTIM